MRRLKDVTRILRSKNAGPFDLTLEIFFKIEEDYLAFKKAGILTSSYVAELYSVAVNSVCVYFCDDIIAVKVVLPRNAPAGDVACTDVFGAQQHGLLLNIEF